MRPYRLIDLIPDLESGLKPAQFGRQLLHLIELFLVSAEGALYSAIALRIVRPVEVMDELQLFHLRPKVLQELSAAIRLHRFHRERELGNYSLQEGSSLSAGEPRPQDNYPLPSEAVHCPKLEHCFAPT